jgi:hypothetical protein
VEGWFSQLERRAVRRGVFPTTPALIMTAHLDGDAINAAYDLGAAFLLKPVAPARIHRFLSSHAPVRPPKAVLHGSERKGLFVRRKPC